MLTATPSAGVLSPAHHLIDTPRQSWMPVSGNTFNATIAWGTANLACYVPTRVSRRCIVYKLGFGSASTSTGNVDVGLYDAAGVKIVSTGSTAKSSSTFQVIDVTDTTIGPGLYYLALNNDTTGDTFTCANPAAPNAASRGVLTEALGSVALPGSATWAVDQTLARIPTIAAIVQTVS